jgi:ribosomal protein S19
MNDNNQQLLREKLNHAPVDRCLLTEKLAYLDYVRRITSFDQEEDAFVIKMPPRNLSILPSVVNRLISIHFESGDTVMVYCPTDR